MSTYEIAGNVSKLIQIAHAECVNILTNSNENDEQTIGLVDTRPQILSDYFVRSKQLAQISNALSVTHDSRFPTACTCIIYGRSGYGKSTLASCYFEMYAGSKYWFDCRFPFDKPHLTTKDQLLVFDHVICDHPLVSGLRPWIKEFKCKVIMITSDFEVATQIAKMEGLATNIQRVLVRVDGFDKNEAIEFLDAHGCDELAMQFKEYIARVVDGCPLALRAIAALYNARLLHQAVKQASRDLHSAKLEQHIKGVISAYVDVIDTSNQMNGMVKRAIGVLASIPFLGMSNGALCYVLDEDPGLVNEAISMLVAEGFVTTWQHCRWNRSSNSLVVDDSMLILHDTIKKIYVHDLEDQKLKDASRRYSEYLFQFLNERPSNIQQTLATLDIWISFVHCVFGDHFEGTTRFDDFIANLNQAMDLLRIIIPLDCDSYTTQYVSQMLRTKLNDPYYVERSHCDEIIALASALALLPPNITIAKAIWSGATHADGWARAACIRTAMHHFSEYNKRDADSLNIELDNGLQELDDWFRDFLPAVYRREGRFYSVDCDLAAALGGYATLGRLDKAIDFVTRNWQMLLHGIRNTTISDLVVLVNIVDTADRALFLHVSSVVWDRICGSAAKTRVLEYAELYFGGSLGLTAKGPKHSFRMDDFCLTVAHASHSARFQEYVTRCGCDEWSFFNRIKKSSDTEQFYVDR